MKNIIIVTVLFFSTNLFADLIEEGTAKFAIDDYKSAIIIFSKSCDSGNIKGCVHLGATYIVKTETKTPNYKLAIKAFEKACKSGNKPACRQYKYYNNKKD